MVGMDSDLTPEVRGRGESLQTVVGSQLGFAHTK